MKTVVINAEDDATIKLLTSLAKKMGLRSGILSDSKKEDLALIKAINEGMKGTKLPVQSSYKILDNLLK